LALNVGGGDPVSLTALAQAMIEANGGGTYDIREFPPERKRIDVGDFLIDDRRFRALSGWRPRIGIAGGLRRSIEYYRSHLASYI
jgi:UDP-glucose 4-epimerase